MSDHYVLLGAGFSRAICDEMPLLHDLSEQVFTELGLSRDALAPFGGDLEQWLSHLSSNQPWLTDQENLRNLATFRDASEAVHTCIVRSETVAVASPIPSWLTRLIWHWCTLNANIATYNYDVLLETSVSHLSLTRTWADLYAMPIAERRAPGDVSQYPTEQPPSSVLRLFKLHGSTNWFYGGPDAPVTDRVVMTQASGWWPGSPAEHSLPRSSGRQTNLYDDLLPLIIPPTGTKGGYYGNRSLRAQWQTAFTALKAAKSLTIIGYSFPPSDLAARHFIASSRLAVPVAVVDRRPEVAATVEALLPSAAISAYSGEQAIEKYVDDTCGDVVLWGVQHNAAGRRSRLQVNGIDIDLSGEVNPYDPDLPTGDPDPASTWIAQEVERKYPGATRAALRDHWPRSNDGTLWQGIYTGPRQSE